MHGCIDSFLGQRLFSFRSRPKFVLRVDFALKRFILKPLNSEVESLPISESLVAVDKSDDISNLMFCSFFCPNFDCFLISRFLLRVLL